MKVPGLRAVRERALLTRHELAERAGIAYSTICRLEQGASARIPTVRALADALQVDAWELLEEPSEGLVPAA